MPRDTVTTVPVDSMEATVQADLLDPPLTGGPPEPTACNGGAGFGHTVWYRFFPDVDGTIELQSVGYDAALALVPFESVDAPLPQGHTCANRRDDVIERLEAPVEGGLGYAVQVGGIAGAAGTLQLSFTFRPDRDGDGVADDEDDCPRQAGTLNGCPRPIVIRISYGLIPSGRGGAQITHLEVLDAPAGARVAYRCSAGCRAGSRRARKGQTPLPALARRTYAAGTRIELRVTKAGRLGDYRRITVRGGTLKVTRKCLFGSSATPRPCP